MGQDSKIEWCHHTFNPWRGCTKVSDGCKHCYADQLSHRNPKSLGVWGPKGTRVVAADAAWREPLKWNRLAQEAGERHRVFCASLADVFEGPETMPAEARQPVLEARARLLSLIDATPHLDWLLLTKRPDRVMDRLREIATSDSPNVAGEMRYTMDGGLYDAGEIAKRWLADAPPANVWLGTSVENQTTAAARIPHLRRCPAAVRFLSMEPLLGAVDAAVALENEVSFAIEGPAGGVPDFAEYVVQPPGIHWVIVGGESGPGARPMHPQWARDIRNQCVAAGVAFFFKQWGEWTPTSSANYASPEGHRYGHNTPGVAMLRNGRICLKDIGPGEPLVLVDDKAVKEFDAYCEQKGPDPGYQWLHRVGKCAAGRLLDGRTWDEMPAAVPRSFGKPSRRRMRKTDARLFEGGR